MRLALLNGLLDRLLWLLRLWLLLLLLLDGLRVGPRARLLRLLRLLLDRLLGRLRLLLSRLLWSRLLNGLLLDWLLLHDRLLLLLHDRLLNGLLLHHRLLLLLRLWLRTLTQRLALRALCGRRQTVHRQHSDKRE